MRYSAKNIFYVLFVFLAAGSAAFFIYFSVKSDDTFFISEFKPESSGNLYRDNGSKIDFVQKIEEETAPKETREEKSKRAQKAKGIYITQNTLRGKKMDQLFDFIKSTELNAVVIDVKDGDGIYFDDTLKEWVARLKKENIWLIARVMVFQDNYIVKERPELSLKRSDGSLWKNYRGWYWVDPSSKDVWDYNLEVIKKAIDYGFEEINFDYIRFPSDGNLETIVYPFWDKKSSKDEIMESFFKYIKEGTLKYNPDIFLSIDIFGYTFISEDTNIGQNLKMLLPYFDFICPMVYPSHYSAGNFGFKNPAEHPYEVITQTFQKQREFLEEQNAVEKIRPWLQAFNVGAVYDARMVGLEKKAAYDFGLDGWLLWNAGNVYTQDILEKEESNKGY